MSGRSLRPKRKAQAGPVGDEVSDSARRAIIILAEGPFWVITGNRVINLIQKRKQTTHRDLNRAVYNDIKKQKGFGINYRRSKMAALSRCPFSKAAQGSAFALSPASRATASGHPTSAALLIPEAGGMTNIGTATNISESAFHNVPFQKSPVLLVNQ
jgi:hypothetical protein